MGRSSVVSSRASGSSSSGFEMNKLILVALLGCVLIALTGAEEQDSDSSLQSIDNEVALQREARDAEAARQKNKNRRKKKNGTKKKKNNPKKKRKKKKKKKKKKK